ncbi:hypothetical protein H4F99_01175 [Lysobacter sp. SG-8]|uniref:DUF5666 domain-containing protein n=1 Tax=Marilutibacter penaei TaxID=2759900 RepID=A0A7W3U1D6_9GAMM|nr:hypothetical protein [Lysobacter penaei]MBB1087094.1 hypothetical protein [Lysobacter penaei]
MRVAFRQSIVRAVALAASLALLAACNSMPPTPEKQDVASMEMSVEGRVTHVDSSSRVITVTDETGYAIEVEAGPDVRNFDQIRVGDTVGVRYLTALAVGVQHAGDAKPGVYETSDEDVARAGERPYRGQTKVTTIVAPITAVDVANHTITVQGPQGKEWTFYVEKPENQARLATLEQGDMLQVSYITALAVGVERR